ncbi:MAG: hypothetical protein HY606_06845 [Planctomycetes bacterium]|nr:hypothetical protein [Planctomycetota bacterium]
MNDKQSRTITLNIHEKIFGIRLTNQFLADDIERRFAYFIHKENNNNNVKYDLILSESELLDRHDRTTPIEHWIAASIQQSIYHKMREKYLFFHANCVAKDGFATVFIGPPLSGKSTTAVIAMMNGYQILSDEVAMISRSNGQVFAFPHPLHVRSTTNFLLTELFPEQWSRSGLMYSERVYIKPSVNSAVLKQIYLLENSHTHPAIFMLQNMSVKSRFYVYEDLRDIIELVQKFNTRCLNTNLNPPSRTQLKKTFLFLESLFHEQTK